MRIMYAPSGMFSRENQPSVLVTVLGVKMVFRVFSFKFCEASEVFELVSWWESFFIVI